MRLRPAVYVAVLVFAGCGAGIPIDQTTAAPAPSRDNPRIVIHEIDPTTTTTTATEPPPPPPPPTTAPTPPPHAPVQPAATETPPAGSGDPYDAIARWFPELYGKALAVAGCESSLDPGAISKGGGNWGLFQINTVHRGQFQAVTGRPWSAVLEADANAQFARWLYDQSGWGSWSCRGAT